MRRIETARSKPGTSNAKRDQRGDLLSSVSVPGMYSGPLDVNRTTECAECRHPLVGDHTAWSGPSGSGTRAYDNFGNATSQALSGTTNHYTAMTYDAAGNVLSDGTAAYTYPGPERSDRTILPSRRWWPLRTGQRIDGTVT